jgi:vancomycin resistance protein YoaR
VILGLVAAALLLVGFRVARSGSLPQMEVAGVDVGDMERDALEAKLRDIAHRRQRERIEVVRPRVEGRRAARRTYPRRALGYSFDAAATAERVLDHGRQTNPLAALADHLRASFTTIQVDPVESVDQEALDEWVAQVADELAIAPVEGDIEFHKGKVQPVMPRSGAVVDEGVLRDAARRAALTTGGQTVEMALEEVSPDMTTKTVKRAVRRARKILARPITLRRAGAEVSLRPADVSVTLSTRTVEGEQGPQLQFQVDAERLESEAGGTLAQLERSPVDAGFSLSGGTVHVIAGRPGLTVDHEALAERLIRIATSEDRTAQSPVDKQPPEFTTGEARDLDIDEQVSTFTTEHACCEPRVHNIHRIADIVDGTVVMPGESFSLNGTVGERTRAKGFVPAPGIYEGEYVDEVGGGVSQFATTMFNAIFFGSYEFVEYKAHSYYISRYPAGREATLSWPAVDLEFRNDSDAGIYIDTSYTDTSITVTFYGTTDVEVKSWSGPPHNYTDPPEQCRTNKALAKGERRVVQEGSQGFDIVVKRIFIRSGDRETEEFFTRYLPEPRIVEQRTCSR